MRIRSMALILSLPGNLCRGLSPEVVSAFDKHLDERSAHIWNMAIMRRDVLDAWCSWLFPVLARVENEIDFESMTSFEARVVGRLSERLLDPWLEVTQSSLWEVKSLFLEPVKWGRKGASFLAAKFLRRKYDSSF